MKPGDDLVEAELKMLKHLENDLVWETKRWLHLFDAMLEWESAKQTGWGKGLTSCAILLFLRRELEGRNLAGWVYGMTADIRGLQVTAY